MTMMADLQKRLGLPPTGVADYATQEAIANKAIEMGLDATIVRRDLAKNSITPFTFALMLKLLLSDPSEDV